MREMSLVSNTRVVQLFQLKFSVSTAIITCGHGSDLARESKEHCGRSDLLHPAIRRTIALTRTCDKQTLFWTDVVLSCRACQCLTRGFAFISNTQSMVMWWIAILILTNCHGIMNLFFTKINFHWKSDFLRKFYTTKIWNYTVLSRVAHIGL